MISEHVKFWYLSSKITEGENYQAQFEWFKCATCFQAEEQNVPPPSEHVKFSLQKAILEFTEVVHEWKCFHHYREWVEAVLQNGLPSFSLSLLFQQQAAISESSFKCFFLPCSRCSSAWITAVMLRNSVFSCFVFYGVLLVLKMYVMAVITGQIRLRKKVSELLYMQLEVKCCVSFSSSCLFSGGKLFFLLFVFSLLPWKAFANPEDALRHGGLQYHREDPYVERCRRWACRRGIFCKTRLLVFRGMGVAGGWFKKRKGKKRESFGLDLKQQQQQINSLVFAAYGKY